MISEALAFGWKGFKSNWMTILKVILISFVIGIVAGFVIGALPGIGQVVQFMLNTYFALGGTYIALKIYDGQIPQWKDLFGLNSRYWNYLVTNVIYSFMITVGFLLFIVPGIYLILKYWFATVLVADKGMKPIEALKESSRITKGYKWNLLGILIVFMLVGALGFMVFLVGGLVSMWVAGLAWVYVYKALLKRGVQPQDGQTQATV